MFQAILRLLQACEYTCDHTYIPHQVTTLLGTHKQPTSLPCLHRTQAEQLPETKSLPSSAKQKESEK